MTSEDTQTVQGGAATSEQDRARENAGTGQDTRRSDSNTQNSRMMMMFGRMSPEKFTLSLRRVALVEAEGGGVTSVEEMATTSQLEEML